VDVKETEDPESSELHDGPIIAPVNALLSLGYTFLFNEVMGAVCMIGLDPYLGSLHVVEYGRPSLPLDLMEEWRRYREAEEQMSLSLARVLIRDPTNDFATDLIRRWQRNSALVRRAEPALRTFLPRKAMHLRAGVSYKSFAAEIRKAKPGIYIVGLDTHVGFLVVPKNGAFHFIHSSASAPRCVVEEPQTKATALARSHYRVFGNLTADPEVLRRWLLEKPFPVGKR
jgi:hypothetical protein